VYLKVKEEKNLRRGAEGKGWGGARGLQQLAIFHR